MVIVMAVAVVVVMVIVMMVVDGGGGGGGCVIGCRPRRSSYADGRVMSCEWNLSAEVASPNCTPMRPTAAMTAQPRTTAISIGVVPPSHPSPRSSPPPVSPCIPIAEGDIGSSGGGRKGATECRMSGCDLSGGCGCTTGGGGGEGDDEGGEGDGGGGEGSGGGSKADGEGG